MLPEGLAEVPDAANAASSGHSCVPLRNSSIWSNLMRFSTHRQGGAHEPMGPPMRPWRLVCDGQARWEDMRRQDGWTGQDEQDMQAEAESASPFRGHQAVEDQSSYSVIL